ncbi:carboxylesterase [Streptococcus sp. DD11]|uniref:alpha/beta fold hydrolase n=1 Tax=Streptococcus sp. DD11 TaxID=1777879 RepID=UPI00079A06B0|nr:alpha/beta hydrolase [Streptococcus sp. DD11]KXT85471.1 carboxylesterase [Streptococcus sp. DD11]
MKKAEKKKGRLWKQLFLFISLSACFYTVRSLFFAIPEVGHFKTKAGQAAYLKSYERIMESMPVKAQVQDVETSWGLVRVYRWSNETVTDKTPVLLFPGHSSGAPMWQGNISYLMLQHPVYAFDPLGDAGKSKQVLPLKNMQDVADYVNEMLDRLGIERVHLVGHSFGASSAAYFANDYPARVASLALLEPAFALNYPDVSVFFWGTVSSIELFPESWRSQALAQISGEDASEVRSDDDMAKMIKAASSFYETELPTPSPIDEASLKYWKFPVYLALAEKSKMTGDSTMKQARKIPRLTMKKWPNTSHSLPMEVPQELAHELQGFWKRAENN